MKTDYLSWYKNQLLEIHGREDIISLVSSSVDEPWIVFNRQISEHKVCVAPGRFFGDQSHIRIGFGGSPDKLREGLKRFIEGLDIFMEQMI